MSMWYMLWFDSSFFNTITRFFHSYINIHSENHNFANTTKLIREQGVTSKGISIGNNVWVGAKVTFLDGCVVGNNCVVAAGAVVNGVFPDNCVIGGVPAKIIKNIE